MRELYCIENSDVYGKLERLLLRHIPAPIEILRSQNGKPYLSGNPLYFSLSHSGNRALVALSDRPVGVDLELDKKCGYAHIYARFSPREQREIHAPRDFLLHWTAREAFVKMKGETLARTYRRMEYFDGKIFLDGEEQNCETIAYRFDFGVATVCCPKFVEESL